MSVHEKLRRNDMRRGAAAVASPAVPASSKVRAVALISGGHLEAKALRLDVPRERLGQPVAHGVRGPVTQLALGLRHVGLAMAHVALAEGGVGGPDAGQ